MKKVLVSALVVCAMSMSSVVFAQENKPTERRIEQKKEFVCKMAKELNLSDEQVEQMKESNEKMRAARQQHQEEMDRILTPEQKEKMKELRKQNIDKSKMRRHHRHNSDSMKPCPQMKGRCVEKKGNCSKMQGDCPQMKARCADKKHDCSHKSDSCRMHQPCKKMK